MHCKIKFLFLLLAVSTYGCNQQEASKPAVKAAKIEGRWYSQTDVKLGNQVFTNNCAICHGANAQSTFNWRKKLPNGTYPPPPLNGSAHAWHHSFSQLMQTINEGGLSRGGKMPGFREKLTKVEKQAAVAYFQNFWSDEIYGEWLKRGGLN